MKRSASFFALLALVFIFWGCGKEVGPEEENRVDQATVRFLVRHPQNNSIIPLAALPNNVDVDRYTNTDPDHPFEWGIYEGRGPEWITLAADSFYGLAVHIFSGGSDNGKMFSEMYLEIEGRTGRDTLYLDTRPDGNFFPLMFKHDGTLETFEQHSVFWVTVTGDLDDFSGYTFDGPLNNWRGVLPAGRRVAFAGGAEGSVVQVFLDEQEMDLAENIYVISYHSFSGGEAVDTLRVTGLMDMGSQEMKYFRLRSSGYFDTRYGDHDYDSTGGSHSDSAYTLQFSYLNTSGSRIYLENDPSNYSVLGNLTSPSWEVESYDPDGYEAESGDTIRMGIQESGLSGSFLRNLWVSLNGGSWQQVSSMESRWNHNVYIFRLTSDGEAENIGNTGRRLITFRYLGDSSARHAGSHSHWQEKYADITSTVSYYGEAIFWLRDSDGTPKPWNNGQNWQVEISDVSSGTVIQRGRPTTMRTFSGNSNPYVALINGHFDYSTVDTLAGGGGGDDATIRFWQRQNGQLWEIGDDSDIEAFYGEPSWWYWYDYPDNGYGVELPTDWLYISFKQPGSENTLLDSVYIQVDNNSPVRLTGRITNEAGNNNVFRLDDSGDLEHYYTPESEYLIAFYVDESLDGDTHAGSHTNFLEVNSDQSVLIRGNADLNFSVENNGTDVDPRNHSGQHVYARTRHPSTGDVLYTQEITSYLQDDGSVWRFNCHVESNGNITNN